MRQKIKIIILFILVSTCSANAQRIIQDTTIRIFMIGGVTSFNFTAADMAKRFGPNATIGASFWYKSASNWLLGLEYNFIFSGGVRETGMLDSISTKSDDPDKRYLINASGEVQLLTYGLQGHLPFIKIGKIFSFGKPNINSGFFIKAGAGFLQHKIKYSWPPSQEPPQLAGEYVKGYDRFTSGLASSQSIGYLFLGNNNRINFSAEFEIIEGFTRNRRAMDFDLMRKNDSQRLDIMYGIKFSWFFPIYNKSASKYDFY